MKSKMLGALALFTLIGALFVMQSAATSTPTVDAATGSIDALNVGTCLTTSTDVFGKESCSLSGDGTGANPVKWEVRKDVTEVDELYATYAYDPKTASNDPRAILTNSDLLKISIADPERDKRSGVLIKGASIPDATVAAGLGIGNTVNEYIDDDAPGSLGALISEDLGDDFNYERGDPNLVNTGDDDDIKLTHSVGADIALHVSSNTSSSVIGSSGNVTLNFNRAGTGADAQDFKPGDFKVDRVDDGAIVRFYGCLEIGTGDGECDPDGSDDTANTADDEPFIELSGHLTVDEDTSNGNAFGNTAPWLGVNASVPDGKDIAILAIYYRTSDQEHLIGGESYYYCSTGTPAKERDENGNDVWKCGTDDAMKRNVTENDSNGLGANVDYTDDEIDDNDALLVRATADGGLEERSVNLYLKETGRFDGVYQGFLRLTDENGDGRDENSTTVKEDIDNWGRQVMKGSSHEDSGAAVLAVESGAVTIEYQDTDGRKRILRIEIDNQAPTINVTSPSHGSASGDQTPDFSGTIEDSGSGLVDGSFRLVVDNRVDSNGEEGKNNGFALDGKAPKATNVVLRTATPALVQATRKDDYAGYQTTGANAPSQFGEVPASDLYNLGDDRCDDGQEVCHILSDEYDDGATRGTFDDSLRLDLYATAGETLDLRDKEFEIDFQAFVMDMAGNIGFSDSDPGNPRFINDLGAEKDRKVPNVLGSYSAHIITLDEKDPEIQNAQTATGYFGLNSGGAPIADRSGVMVVFDAPIAASSVSTSTFSVELDDGSTANIVDARVEKQYAFLKLDSELASDATPKIDIADGEKVEDMAGNETFGREQNEFEANDGISPRLTVTLSGGSGIGTGNEGPDKLTRDQITIHVSSDEALQGSPKLAVVCSGLRWNEGEKADMKRDIDDYVANRMTASHVEPGEGNLTRTPVVANTNVAYDYTCGYEDGNGVVQEYDPDDDGRTSARPGENWEDTWQNPTSAAQKLRDGGVTVVAFASDRSRYSMGGQDNVRNWGSASTTFTLDTKVVYPDPSSDITKGGDLQPAPDGQSKEARPFVLIEFDESTTVTLNSVEIDGVEIASEFEQPDHNRFVYWPESLSQGDHEVEVEASDAAGNEASFSYEFETVARGDFVIGLNAGWNAISVPADPVDTAIGSVFTDPAVTTVIGWDTQGWRIAMRRDGVWESNEKYGALNEIRAKYGYWVKSNGFVRQAVALKGGTSRDAGGTPILISIPTEPGWNFVGVVDQDGDQTEDDFGNDLIGSDLRQIPASEYLGSNYVRAYTWDATFSRFDVVRPNDAMTIGKGVWVYYPEGTGIAP